MTRTKSYIKEWQQALPQEINYLKKFGGSRYTVTNGRLLSHSNQAVDVLMAELAAFIKKKKRFQEGDVLRYGGRRMTRSLQSDCFPFPFVMIDEKVLWLGLPLEGAREVQPPYVAVRLRSIIVCEYLLKQI